MNRNIRFKGKRISNDKWVYGDLIIHPNHTGKEYYIHEHYSDTEYLVDERTIGQFINMYDKHNVGIFEGDIVRCIYNGNVFEYIVVWDDDELDFKFTNGEENYGHNFIYPKSCDEHWNGSGYNIEVIGNIYEEAK